MFRRRDKHDYLKPKYGTLTSITLESDFFGLPTTVEAVAELLTELPEGFSKQFQYGLGLKWEYRFIPQTISNIPSINALIIDESKEVRIDGNRYILGLPRYHQLRRALNTISRKYQSEAHGDKRLLAYTNLLRATDPEQFPLKTKKLRANAIYELVKLGARVETLSGNDQKAALQIVQANKDAIVKASPKEALQLKADIEHVTLNELIVKFEAMLSKNLTEPVWQEFFKENPFILSLAFTYPVFMVQDQAYVGGASLTGVGNKIADFLVSNRYTGNLALIEIKRPGTSLLSKTRYRENLFGPSSDLTGAISQVLDQRYALQRNLDRLKADAELNQAYGYSIQCILIVGSNCNTNNERKSFDLVRHSLRDVMVLTFDELLGKLKDLEKLFAAGKEKEIDDRSPI